MLREGKANGSIRDIPELVAYYLLLAPIQTFIAGVPFRDSVRNIKGESVYSIEDRSLEPDRFLQDFSNFILAALTPNMSGGS
jgi:hypothetical protein